MHLWQIQSFGIDGLVRREVPEPVPGPGQVLVRVHAVSLNYRDLLMVQGAYNPRMALPRIPCSDGAGEVAGIGAGVSAVAVGDRVAGIFMQNWLEGRPSPARVRGALGGDIDGMLAEYVVLPEHGVVHIPGHLTYAEAATLPCAGVTAWNALVHAAAIKAGDVVLIQGTGGVSIFALQFAKLLGARVLGTSSSDAKLRRAETLGLDAGFNYQQSAEWARWVMDETEQEGADLVVEVGGAGTFTQSIRAVRMGGVVAQIGNLSNSKKGLANQHLEIAPILHRQVQVKGIYVGSREDFEEMNRALRQSGMRPVIGETVAFAEARRGFQALASGSHFGKIVIQAVA